MIKLGVDVGGTFTDIVVVDEKEGKINLTKVPSTPRSPDQGVLNGVNKMREMFNIHPEDIEFLFTERQLQPTH